MFYKDHEPPHFHAVYSGYEISIDIKTGIINGRFPKRALSAVMEWHEINKESLLIDWELARDGKPLKPIPPLE